MTHPVDRLGNVLGPKYYDSDNLPTLEQLRRSHSDEFSAWFDKPLAKARAARLRRMLATAPRGTMH